MKNDSVKSLVVLTTICLVVAALLGTVNFITAPIIAASEEKAAKAACFEVMEGAADFAAVDTSAYDLPASVGSVFRETEGRGYVFKISTRGYANGLVIVVGVDTTGAVTGIRTVATSETDGLGAVLADSDHPVIRQYVGKTDVSGVESLSGATKSSNGYKNAVADALAAFGLLSREG